MHLIGFKFDANAVLPSPDSLSLIVNNVKSINLILKKPRHTTYPCMCRYGSSAGANHFGGWHSHTVDF